MSESYNTISTKINKILRDAGWTPREERNQDGLNLEGETNEGKVCFCTLTLAMGMPDESPADDLDTILLFIEEIQRSEKQNEKQMSEKTKEEDSKYIEVLKNMNQSERISLYGGFDIIRVPGGWIYAIKNNADNVMTSCFVPVPVDAEKYLKGDE